MSLPDYLIYSMSFKPKYFLTALCLTCFIPCTEKLKYLNCLKNVKYSLQLVMFMLKEFVSFFKYGCINNKNIKEKQTYLNTSLRQVTFEFWDMKNSKWLNEYFLKTVF